MQETISKNGRQYRSHPVYQDEPCTTFVSHTVIYIYVCVCVYIYVCGYLCVCMYMYMRIFICVHICVHLHIYKYIFYVYIYIYVLNFPIFFAIWLKKCDFLTEIRSRIRILQKVPDADPDPQHWIADPNPDPEAWKCTKILQILPFKKAFVPAYVRFLTYHLL
jgi:hypothetical protein